MRKLLVLLFVIVLVPPAFGVEIHLKKNEAVELVFPMLDASTPKSFKTGETVLDDCSYADTPGTWVSLAIADDVSEIGTSGMYQLIITADEMNHDHISCKFSSTNTADNSLIIKTFTSDVDDVYIELEKGVRIRRPGP